MKLFRLAAASVLAALVGPAAAFAHPGVYTVDQAVRSGSCSYPDASCLTTRTQYDVANDGWALSFTEDNGLTTPGGGMINYKAMPSGWRTPMTSEDKRTYSDAKTALQAHATCTLPALDSAATLAWQGSDPFFDYIPWQSKSAGLGDDPAKWIPVVKQKTGVDLTGMADDHAKAACATLAGSDTAYHKADTPATVADALLASVTSPLQSQVSQLQNQVGVLQAGKAASDAAAAAAETARLALANRPLELTLSAKKFDAADRDGHRRGGHRGDRQGAAVVGQREGAQALAHDRDQEDDARRAGRRATGALADQEGGEGDRQARPRDEGDRQGRRRRQDRHGIGTPERLRTRTAVRAPRPDRRPDWRHST